MKKFLSCTKTAVVLLIATIIWGCAYVYTLARPISYGMNYECKTVYDGVEFEGKLKFDTDGTMLTVNSSFDKGVESRYYCKDGYIFFLLSTNDETYKSEIKEINKNFKEAVKTPFYASKINAFKMVSEGPDGYSLTYTCKPAIVLAVINAIALIALIALTVVSFNFSKKAKCGAESV